MASIIVERQLDGKIARDGTSSLTNGSQPRDTDGNKSSFLFATEGQGKTKARATAKHPDSKESMDTSDNVSPGDRSRGEKKKRKEVDG